MCAGRLAGVRGSGVLLPLLFFIDAKRLAGQSKEGFLLQSAARYGIIRDVKQFFDGGGCMFRIGKRLITVLMAFFLIAVCAGALWGCRDDEPVPDDTAHLPTLRIGSDEYPPYFYVDDDGSFAGVDVELATEACRRMGFRAEFVVIDWSKKDEVLASGEVDCLWGCFSMTGREDRYSWAGPYMTSREVVAVREDSGIERLADLADKRIAVQATTMPDVLFSSGTDPRIPPIKQLYAMPEIRNVFAALRKGYVDAIAGHEAVLREELQSTEGRFRILEESLLDVELGVAFEKDHDKQPVDRMTVVLQQMCKDGFVDGVLEKYGLDPEREG